MVFDKFGSDQWDFRPTVFHIKAQDVEFPKIIQNSLNASTHLSDPISFDIEGTPAEVWSSD